MGFSPAQAQHILVPPEHEDGPPNLAPRALNLGLPLGPGLYKRPAERQDGLPYTLLPAHRRYCHDPPGMNPPPLGATFVKLSGVGTDGKPLCINFDFLGLLSSDQMIFGALAHPESTDLAAFPRLVAVKVIRKADLARENLKYLWLCVEVEAMKKLAGQDFINGALAVFQDDDFVFIVSVCHNNFHNWDYADIVI